MGGLPWDATRRIKDSEKEIAAANHPLLRHFKVPRLVATAPLDDVNAKWELTTPKSVVNKSAVAYIFGETLMKELKVPVGLIDCSWGGTRIEPWTPAGHPDDLWLLQNIHKWDRPHDKPTVLWNGMVAGLVPYAIKGAIWYQGCANRWDGEKYIDKTEALVRGWRREWGQGAFPYFLVQLAPFKYEDTKGESLPIIQMAQAKIPERVPNTGYTVINDVGNVNDIHPTDKRTVGMRMADQALERVYGKKVREWRSPIASGWEVKDGCVRVHFKDAAGLTTRDGKAPNEFEVRTLVDGWVSANARIEGTDVVLTASGDKNDTIIGVRFAPYNASTPNLMNGAGIPAGPFKFSRACPLGAAEELARSAGYRCVQRYDIPAQCDFHKALPKSEEVKGAKKFAYLLELEGKDGDTTYCFAEMDAFAEVAPTLPSDNFGTRTLRAKLTNLKVRSNSSEVKTRDLPFGGFMEFYDTNYATARMAEPAGGDDKKHDFNDTPRPGTVNGLGYGCFQIHDLTKKDTLMAFNHFNNGSVPCDIGIGRGRGEHPDWTFARNAASYKTRRFSVWVK